ncbi:MAG TPA: succinate dehydrogenase, cytochrome b556 subunit [Anaerolineaceae bacterium]|nr:succinate dehydrogenase, cytochrome b556 subunit [Anaerolineaceae bacterium]
MTAVPEKTSHSVSQPRPNYLGVGGWFYAGRYSIERYLYILHRLSGLGLILYLLLHVIESGIRMQGAEAWTALMALFTSPLFKFFEYVVFVGFIFHALNGLRLKLTELGFFLGKPAQPVYPYDSSLKRHRPLTYALMALAAILIVLGASSILFK